ncbi:MAG: FIST N-terminal domain-containing protein [Syntrophomonadaceae bacterium]|nr:FIST N-terminal domain-containing protein [Syntrophomonadaceae bacterium]
MNIKAVYSMEKNIDLAVADLKKQLNGFDTRMLVVFSSSSYAQEELIARIKSNFASALVCGCSTAGEIVSGKMMKESVVAMALNGNVIGDAKIEVIDNIKEINKVKEAFDSFARYYNEPVAAMDPERYIGMVLMDGLSKSEEKVMDRIGDLTNVVFIGGSAGDDLKFSRTYVYGDGKAYTNAAVLVLIKPKVRFDIIKTQSFVVLDHKFTATKVDPEARAVIEFDHQPAAKVYSEALGVSMDDLEKYFMSNPVGLLIDNEVYVRSPSQLKGTSVFFFCNILEGMEVSLLESTDIVGDTRLAVLNKKKEMGEISGILNFHCILRTLELERKGQTEEYGSIFADIPTIGFSTYGEEYIGHINQTSTMLVFGVERLDFEESGRCPG